MQRDADEYGKAEGIYRMWLGHKPLVILRSPQTAEVWGQLTTHHVRQGALDVDDRDGQVGRVRLPAAMARPWIVDFGRAEVVASTQNAHAHISFRHSQIVLSNIRGASRFRYEI